MAKAGITADWIAADWGTTNLRLWAMAADGRVLAEAASDRGMGSLSPGDYEGALLELASGWLGQRRVTRVLICGMAGARQGWVEAGYRAVPCPPLGFPLTRVATADPRLDIAILPGLSQADPADVMRGEETQIAGVMALLPGFSGHLCLPGTHSKWAEVAGGEVVRFRSFLTGELFALLTRQSVLRHGMASEGDDWPAFDTAVAEAVADPRWMMAGLFPLRAEFLLRGLEPVTARARLSGLLIGAELATAGPIGDVTIVGAGALAERYARAVAVTGGDARRIAGDEAVRAGLAAAYAMGARAE